MTKQTHVGQRFGRLVVVANTGQQDKKKEWLWLLKCDCGNQKIVRTSHLGDTTSCGCLRKDNRANAFVGQRFGRITIIANAGKQIGSREWLWRYRCDCGNEKTARTSHLRVIRSCGCLRAEVSKARLLANGPLRVTHGHTKGQMSSEYRSWLSMRARCNDCKHQAYENYGARGILVCERWQNSFENFFTDMGAKPTRQHTIDRINVNGNYEPSNCRWATKKEQVRNQRVHLRIKELEQLVKELKEQIKLMKANAYDPVRNLVLDRPRDDRGPNPS